MQVLKGYRFRIYPDEEQKNFFKEAFGCVRFTYNHLLMARKGSNHSADRPKITPASLKVTYPFLKKTDSLALANAQRNLERAYTNFYQGRAGYPKLKSKKSAWQSYTTNNQKHTIYIENARLKLPKLKTLVEVYEHRQVNGLIKSATISAKNQEEFFVSLLCLEEVEAMSKTKKRIGISYCPDKLVCLSKPMIDGPTLIEQKYDKKLEREQRKLKLRAKLAKKRHVQLEKARNYQKQKKLVTKLFCEKSSRKSNYIDQLTYALVRQYDYIFVEKQPKLMVEEPNFTQADWYGFLQKIHYKSEWYGKQFKSIELHSRVQNRSQFLEEEGTRLLGE